MGFYGTNKAKELQERQRKNSGGGKYVKLTDDGDMVKCAFLGECYTTYEVWNESTNRSEEYDEEKHGPEKTARPSIAVRWNIWDMETKKVRVFKQRTKFFSTWTETTEELEADGSKWWYKVKRKGKARDTGTTYSLTPVRQMTDDEKEEMAKLELYNLEEEANGNSNSGSSDDDRQQEMRTPSGVKAEKLNELIALCKDAHGKHPNFLEEFFAKFEVSVIRDVSQDRMDEAFNFVQGYGVQSGGAAEKPAADDPFAT